MTELRGIHASLEGNGSDEKGRRIKLEKKNWKLVDFLRCVPPQFGFHHVDCPLVNHSACPVHGENHAKSKPDPCMLVLLESNSEDGRRPILTASCPSSSSSSSSASKLASGWAGNQKDIREGPFRVREICRRNRRIQTSDWEDSAEKRRCYFDGNCFVKITKYFVPEKSERVKKIKNRFHSPCDSLPGDGKRKRDVSVPAGNESWQEKESREEEKRKRVEFARERIDRIQFESGKRERWKKANKVADVLNPEAEEDEEEEERSFRGIGENQFRNPKNKFYFQNLFPRYVDTYQVNVSGPEKESGSSLEFMPDPVKSVKEELASVQQGDQRPAEPSETDFKEDEHMLEEDADLDRGQSESSGSNFFTTCIMVPYEGDGESGDSLGAVGRETQTAEEPEVAEEVKDDDRPGKSRSVSLLLISVATSTSDLTKKKNFLPDEKETVENPSSEDSISEKSPKISSETKIPIEDKSKDKENSEPSDEASRKEAFTQTEEPILSSRRAAGNEDGKRGCTPDTCAFYRKASIDPNPEWEESKEEDVERKKSNLEERKPEEGPAESDESSKQIKSVVVQKQTKSVEVQTSQNSMGQSPYESTLLVEERTTVEKWKNEPGREISVMKKNLLMESTQTKSDSPSTSVKVQNSFSFVAEASEKSNCSCRTQSEKSQFLNSISPSCDTFVQKSFASKESAGAVEKGVKKWPDKSHSDSEVYDEKRIKSDEIEIKLPAGKKDLPLLSKDSNSSSDLDADSRQRKPPDAHDGFKKPRLAKKEEPAEESAPVSDLSELIRIIDQRFDRMADEVKGFCQCRHEIQQQLQKASNPLVDRGVMTDLLSELNSQRNKATKKEIHFADDDDDDDDDAAQRKPQRIGTTATAAAAGATATNRMNVRRAVSLDQPVWVCKTCANKITVFTKNQSTNTSLIEKESLKLMRSPASEKSSTMAAYEWTARRTDCKIVTQVENAPAASAGTTPRCPPANPSAIGGTNPRHLPTTPSATSGTNPKHLPTTPSAISGTSRKCPPTSPTIPRKHQCVELTVANVIKSQIPVAIQNRPKPTATSPTNRSNSLSPRRCDELKPESPTFKSDTPRARRRLSYTSASEARGLDSRTRPNTTNQNYERAANTLPKPKTMPAATTAFKPQTDTRQSPRPQSPTAQRPTTGPTFRSQSPTVQKPTTAQQLRPQSPAASTPSTGQSDRSYSPISPRPTPGPSYRSQSPTAQRPTTGQPYRPQSPTPIRPATGQPYRPQSPTAQRPATGQPYRPQSPTAQRPATGQPYRPQSPTPIRPVTGQSARSYSPSTPRPNSAQSSRSHSPQKTGQARRSRSRTKNLNNPIIYPVLISPFWPEQVIGNLQEKVAAKYGKGKPNRKVKYEEEEEEEESSNAELFANSIKSDEIKECFWLRPTKSESCSCQYAAKNGGFLQRRGEKECPTAKSKTGRFGIPSDSVRTTPRKRSLLRHSERPAKADEKKSSQRKKHSPLKGSGSREGDFRFGSVSVFNFPSSMKKMQKLYKCFFYEPSANLKQRILNRNSVFSDYPFSSGEESSLRAFSEDDLYSNDVEEAD